jgi:3-deoxy-manno-octulosonate cytidylyltransferase (CMP-KDO synthetase)
VFEALTLSCPPSPLQLHEKLDQVRALGLEMTIRADAIEDFPRGVDSPVDLKAARKTICG